jgi:hypothetical protein
MRMALYLLGRSVGNFNLEIAIDKAEIFVFPGGKNGKWGQSESK